MLFASGADAQSPVPRPLPQRPRQTAELWDSVSSGGSTPWSDGAPRCPVPLRHVCPVLPRCPVILPALFPEPLSALSLPHRVTAGAVPRDKPWETRESVGEAPACGLQLALCCPSLCPHSWTRPAGVGSSRPHFLPQVWRQHGQIEAPPQVSRSGPPRPRQRGRL